MENEELDPFALKVVVISAIALGLMVAAIPYAVHSSQQGYSPEAGYSEVKISTRCPASMVVEVPMAGASPTVSFHQAKECGGDIVNG